MEDAKSDYNVSGFINREDAAGSDHPSNQVYEIDFDGDASSVAFPKDSDDIRFEDNLAGFNGDRGR